jgi:hypothetical protein
MAVWLKGVGRSHADLARLLSESHGNPDAEFRRRRANDRQGLNHAQGQLVFGNSKIPCLGVEMSVGGCSLLIENPFPPGALAAVEVMLNILGMALHIRGITQWLTKDRRMGIKFVHANDHSKYQVEALIACLRGQLEIEYVKDTVASAHCNLSYGDVLVVQDPKTVPASSMTVERRHTRWKYDPKVHCGAARLHIREEDIWRLEFQSTSSGQPQGGATIDLSLIGCTIRSDKPFEGRVNDPVEIKFALNDSAFMACGSMVAIYDSSNFFGVQFSILTDDQRKDLALFLVETCAAKNAKLQVG